MKNEVTHMANRCEGGENETKNAEDLSRPQKITPRRKLAGSMSSPISSPMEVQPTTQRGETDKEEDDGYDERYLPPGCVLFTWSMQELGTCMCESRVLSFARFTCQVQASMGRGDASATLVCISPVMATEVIAIAFLSIDI
ncbi:hypothetical protein RJT34_32683 [Clitoria ternatea]|uniref:Uncharacterized protein n=1 Tax=Clitoria ternatea TaxID=43366 RepID=A0AAN9EWH0_CLITE